MQEQKFYGTNISEDLRKSPYYQKRLKQLREHYGETTITDTYEQSYWAKEHAFNRRYNSVIYPFETALRDAKIVIVSEFSDTIHLRLSQGFSTKDIIRNYGTFCTFQRSFMPVIERLWDKKVAKAIRAEGFWWEDSDLMNVKENLKNNDYR